MFAHVDFINQFFHCGRDLAELGNDCSSSIAVVSEPAKTFAEECTITSRVDIFRGSICFIDDQRDNISEVRGVSVVTPESMIGSRQRAKAVQ